MTQADVVVPGRVPGIHVLRALQERRGLYGDSPDMGDASGHSDRGLVLSTVAISDPLASRSNTRTVDWALARIQSGVPTKHGDLIW